MRIAILTSFPVNPLTPQGGVESVSVNLVAALARNLELELHVITADRECGIASVTEWNGVKIHRLPMGRGKLLTYVRGVGRNRICERLSQLRPDVIHAHDFYGMMVKGLPTPRVFTMHGFIHEDTKYNGGKFAWLRAQMWKRCEVAAWAEQPHIISISPYVREKLRGIARGMIHDIENPIDAAMFEIARDERAGTVFCAGAISRRKNTLGLVQAFAKVRAQCPRAELRLAGPSPDSAYRAEVEAFIARAGLRDSVQWLGSISGAAIREELSRASVFVLPSFEEGAPMGIAEAMAARLPVVTSNRCGMPYMVRHGESGYLIDPHDSGEMANRLAELLSQVELRQRMGAAAREFALERFHPDRVAARTLAVYNCARGREAREKSVPSAATQEELLARQPRTVLL